MNETAQVALAVVCISVAVIAGLAGVALLVAEARRTSSALRRWRNDPRDADSTAARAELVRVVDHLLGNAFDRAVAGALLLVGVVTGGMGAFLTLVAAS